MDKLEKILELLNESRRQQILHDQLYKNEEKESNCDKLQDNHLKAQKQSTSPAAQQDAERKRRYEEEALKRRLKREEERERQKRLEEEQEALNMAKESNKPAK